jgi:gamma-glutamyltranspeptidase/glutathione hydrolase
MTLSRRTLPWLLLLIASPLVAQEYRNGVVVAVSAPGAEAGLEILKEGGNAVDAAVATALALAVTHPAAGNIGGGGFMMVRPPKGEPVLIDYREVAPAAATRDMFVKQTAAHEHRVVAVPGTLRGLELAHKKFGKLPWARLVQPAIRLADEGFVLDDHHAKSLNDILKSSPKFAELQRVFSNPHGKPWQAGDRLIQPDLAKTMKRIAEKGPDTFYTGAVAELIAQEMKAGGGLVSLDDLKKFKAIERTPIHGTYRGYDIYAPPPPSAGGTILMLMLNMLEPLELKKQPRFSPETLHVMAETMRRAYRERAEYLGDPAFSKIPGFLLSPEHARKLAATIDRTKATPSAALAGNLKLSTESDSTTHFSVIDKDGFAVSNTYTLEHGFGSRIVVRGGGFLLNNEMTDFNWRPGVTDKTGRIGSEPNTIAPGKKMLSSQTPTIVVKDGKVILVTGSPGGRTITNTMLNVLVNVLEYDMPLQEAIDAPRLHHQWFPDQINFERTKEHAGFVEALRKMGHTVVEHKQGDAHSIWVNPRTGGYVGAADKRLSGKVAGY